MEGFFSYSSLLILRALHWSGSVWMVGLVAMVITPPFSVLLLSIQDTGTSGVKKKTYFDIGH